MASHRFDPVSFVFGAVALAAGLVVLAGGTLSDEGRVLLPAGLIGLGVALLVKVVGRQDETAPGAAAVGSTATAVGDDLPPTDRPADADLGLGDDGIGGLGDDGIGDDGGVGDGSPAGPVPPRT